MGQGSFLARLASPFTAFGPAGLVYLADRALVRVFGHRCGLHLYEVVAQPVPETPLLPARRSRDLTFKPLDSNAPELGLLPPGPEVIRSRFAQGAHCLAVYRRASFIGYIWFCFESYDEDEVRCRYVLPQDQRTAFDFDLYVFPEHRAGLGFASVWTAANEFLRARGVGWTVSRISRFNVASRRAHARLGAIRTGRVMTLRLGRFELMMTTLRPILAVSWGRGRPRLTLEVPANR